MITQEKQHAVCLVVDEKSSEINWHPILTNLDTSFTFRICSDYQQASMILAKENISLVLLSIFPVAPDELDAQSFFYRIRASYPIILIVNTVNILSKYSFEEENIIDCLKKPVLLPRLQLAFHKYFRYQQYQLKSSKKEYIFLKMGNILRKFNFNEIMYVQAHGIFSKVNTVEGTFVVNETISELENTLPPDRFSRIHRSYLIGIDHLVGYKKSSALLPHITLPIGNKYKNNSAYFLSN